MNKMDACRIHSTGWRQPPPHDRGEPAEPCRGNPDIGKATAIWKDASPVEGTGGASPRGANLKLTTNSHTSFKILIKVSHCVQILDTIKIGHIRSDRGSNLAISSVSKSSTVLRALKVMEVVGENREAVSAADVAQEIGADRSTTYRMLATLEDAGYVVRDESGRKFKLSYKVISLGRNLLAEDEQDELIRAALRELASKTNEAVNYSILEGRETVIIMRAKGSHLVSVDFQVGDRAAVHCTSIGKVLLAYQSRAYIEDVIDHGLPLVAKNTITDPDVFRAELQRVRSQGYAIDDGEFADEMRCIAFPIFESGGKIKGGINFSGPSTRFTYEKLDELRDIALHVVGRLTQQLGGTGWRA